MKKIFAFILIIALVFTFTGCGAKEAKKDIDKYLDEEKTNESINL